MKVLAVIALCLAASLSVDANTCSTACGGVCTVSKTACDLAVIVGPVCDLGLTVCSKACEVGCKCPDECSAECTPALDTCRSENEGKAVGLAECSFTFAACVASCKDECGANIFKAVVQGIDVSGPA